MTDFLDSSLALRFLPRDERAAGTDDLFRGGAACERTAGQETVHALQRPLPVIRCAGWPPVMKPRGFLLIQGFSHGLNPPADWACNEQSFLGDEGPGGGAGPGNSPGRPGAVDLLRLCPRCNAVQITQAFDRGMAC